MIQKATKTKVFSEASAWRVVPDPEEWRAARIARLEGDLQNKKRAHNHHRIRDEIRETQQTPAEHIRGCLESRHEKETEERLSRWESICHGTRYAECTLSNYVVTCDKQRKAVATITAFRNALPQHLAHGTNLLLYGTVGTGKDHLLAALLKTIVMDLWRDHHLTWDTGYKIAASAKAELGKGVYYSPSVLAISDPVCSSETAMFYTQQRLHELIDTQYSNGRAVWLTVNCRGRSQLNKMLGPRLVDRVCDKAVLVPCFWTTHRKPSINQPKCEAPRKLVSEGIG